jgi:ribosomal protein L3 glutamine methyltransferase
MHRNLTNLLPLSTVGEALQYCCDALQNSDVYFGHGTDNPWDESVQLVLSLSGLPLSSGDEVLSRTLSEKVLSQISAILNTRLSERTPMPYLLGKAQFAGLEFYCDARAIVPRSPIAELVLNGFQPWYTGPEPQTLLDLCCGGGCIGLSAAHYFPNLVVDLLDVDISALALARENAVLLDVSDRVNILDSDLFSGLSNQGYDIILSNPPYVNASDLSAMPAEYHHEPELALGSGADGLLLTRKILASAAQYLNDEGLLVVEVGNSWVELEELYPLVPFTWIEFEHGGHGVLAITAKELREYCTSPTR